MARQCGHSQTGVMGNYRRYFEPDQTVFVTAVTRDHLPWLREDRLKRLLLRSMREVKSVHPFRHKAHVILDDHFHWLLEARGRSSISRIVYAVKRNFKRDVARAGISCPRVWQPRFWDHVIRNRKDFERHFDYIHFNPVKHGYVRMPCQYRWSSFHAWVARGVYPKTWGTGTPETINGMELE